MRPAKGGWAPAICVFAPQDAVVKSRTCSFRDLFQCAATRLDVRDLGDVPAAADCFYQQDAGSHAARQDVDGGDFVGERGALRGGDFEIVGDATLVASDGELRASAARRRRRSASVLASSSQDAQRGEIVFDFLKGGEHRLAIIVDGLVPGGFGLIGHAAAAPRVEQGLRRLPAEHPETAGPLDECTGNGAFKTSRSR